MLFLRAQPKGPIYFADIVGQDSNFSSFLLADDRMNR
jgi:hypothetical protein